jgi:hypothetical protein
MQFGSGTGGAAGVKGVRAPVGQPGWCPSRQSIASLRAWASRARSCSPSAADAPAGLPRTPLPVTAHAPLAQGRHDLGDRPGVAAIGGVRPHCFRRQREHDRGLEPPGIRVAVRQPACRASTVRPSSRSRAIAASTAAVFPPWPFASLQSARVRCMPMSFLLVPGPPGTPGSGPQGDALSAAGRHGDPGLGRGLFLAEGGFRQDAGQRRGQPPVGLARRWRATRQERRGAATCSPAPGGRSLSRCTARLPCRSSPAVRSRSGSNPAVP